MGVGRERRKGKSASGGQVRWKLWAMVVLFGSAWLPRLAFREIGPRRRFWLFGPPTGVAWLLHPAAYPFAPRDFSGFGLVPCFDGLSSPPGFRLAWRKQGYPRRPVRPSGKPGGQNGATGVIRAAGFWPASPSANLGVWSLRGAKGIRLHHAVFLYFSCSSWCGGLFRPAVTPSGRGASRVLDLPWIQTGSLCPVFLVGSAASPPALDLAGSGSRPCRDSPTKQ